MPLKKDGNLSNYLTVFFINYWRNKRKYTHRKIKMMRHTKMCSSNSISSDNHLQCIFHIRCRFSKCISIYNTLNLILSEFFSIAIVFWNIMKLKQWNFMIFHNTLNLILSDFFFNRNCVVICHEIETMTFIVVEEID